MSKYIALDDYMIEEDYREMLDEELDEAYRPKQINNRKSYASAYILQILQLNTNKNNTYTRKDICRHLSYDPYAINLERKALGRVMNGLVDSCMGIKMVKVNNVEKYWFDPDDIYIDYAA